MMKSDFNLIENLWNRLIGGKFVPDEFAKEIHWQEGLIPSEPALTVEAIVRRREPLPATSAEQEWISA
jgi:hypothetical protein